MHEQFSKPRLCGHSRKRLRLRTQTKAAAPAESERPQRPGLHWLFDGYVEEERWQPTRSW